MDAASDAELVTRCRAGDQAAWEALVDRYARYVHAIVARVYRLDSHDAEDVFQEVFARVFERLDTLRDGDALRPWIAQTARNCAVDSLRRSGREVPVDDVPEGVDDGLARLDEALTVHAALDRLSPECHEILDRFFCRDESYRTIGAELELPVRHDREPDRPLPRAPPGRASTPARPRREENRESSASGGQVGQR